MKSALSREAHSIRTQYEARLLSAWARSDELFGLIRDDQLLAKPIVWRHPFLFYVGHLPAFSWNQICGGILKWQSFNPRYDELFCRGIDPDIDTGECHWHPEIPDEWPTLEETLAYRDRVRDAILEALDVLPRRSSGDVMAQNGRVFAMVLEHEFMHQETLLYMMQELPLDKKSRPSGALRYTLHGAPVSRSIHIPAGKARLGARFHELDFGWDNEFMATIVNVPAFSIDSLPVTNGEYFEFVDSGSYDEERFWRPEDWKWKRLENKRYPNCWVKQAAGWFYRAMFDHFPLSQVRNWPVYVSLAEARAFARWRGKRLPSEAEFHRAAFSGPDGKESTYPWGESAPTPRHGNFDFTSWSPAPVGSHPAGVSRWGVTELVGNGWELTDTPFGPFPGFTPYMRSYPDYSKDFFDGKHFVVKGASWATAADLVRPSFRNWYQGHYSYVFAKFRCVSS